MNCLRITKLIQQIYDKHFKGQQTDWAKYSYAGIDVTIFPNGIDYNAESTGKVIQVKWEIDYAKDHRIINLQCPITIESPLTVVLTEFVNGQK